MTKETTDKTAFKLRESDVQANRHEYVRQRSAPPAGVTIPQFFVPFVTAAAIAAMGLYVSSLASEEAAKLDQRHVVQAEPRMKALEKEQATAKLERQRNTDAIVRIVDAVEKAEVTAQENHDLLIRMAAKQGIVD